MILLIFIFTKNYFKKSWMFTVSCKFQDCFIYFFEKCHRYFIEIVLNLHNALGSTAIFVMLILLGYMFPFPGVLFYVLKKCFVAFFCTGRLLIQLKMTHIYLIFLRYNFECNCSFNISLFYFIIYVQKIHGLLCINYVDCHFTIKVYDLQQHFYSVFWSKSYSIMSSQNSDGLPSSFPIQMASISFTSLITMAITSVQY